MLAILEDNRGVKYRKWGPSICIERTRVWFWVDNLYTKRVLREGLEMYWPYDNAPNKHAIHIQIKAHVKPGCAPNLRRQIYGKFCVSFGSANRQM